MIYCKGHSTVLYCIVFVPWSIASSNAHVHAHAQEELILLQFSMQRSFSNLADVANEIMSCRLLFLISEVLLLICSSSAVQQCSFDSDEGRILACGVGTDLDCPPMGELNDEYRTGVIISRDVNDFHDAYDVHAYRLCGAELASDITLADAITRGKACQDSRETRVFRTVLFHGCNEFFTAGSNKDLTIYAYEDVDGCNGDLRYRFLLINGTGMIATVD